MTKRILVPIAPGTEEMEAVTIIDILVRAGYQVVVASADFEGKLTRRLVAAICAAPAVVLIHHDLFPGALMTGHPNFKDHIPEDLWRNRRVTYDVNNNLLKCHS